MEIVMTPKNPDLLKNKLLLPSLINIIALKNAIETQSPLLQQEKFSDVSLCIRLIREQELDPKAGAEFGDKIVQTLRTYFLMSGEDVDIVLQD